MKDTENTKKPEGKGALCRRFVRTDAGYGLLTL